MIKNSSQNNDYLEGIEISNEAIFLDPEKQFSIRELIIESLKKIIKEKKLKLSLGPELDLLNIKRPVMLNNFDIQLVSSGMLADEVEIDIENCKEKGKGPQLFLAAQVEEDLNIVFFKGLLTSQEFIKIIKKRDIKSNKISIPISHFNGGIDKLLRYIRLLDTKSIPRVELDINPKVVNWDLITRKIKLSVTAALGTAGLIIFGPNILQPKLVANLSSLTPKDYEVKSFTRSSTKNSVCLLTPIAYKNDNNELVAKINIDKPIIYLLKPLNELSISIDKNIVWKKIASSKEKINGPIYWPIKPIKSKDEYKLLLRPQGSAFGSNLVINLETDQNIPLTNIDNFIDTLGDNKRKWIKAINKKIKSNRNLGISLLFSKKAPDTKELEKAKLQLDKLNACESI